MSGELLKAIRSGRLTEDQVRQLIEHQTGVSFDEARSRIETGEFPDTIEWTDAQLLLELIRINAA